MCEYCNLRHNKKIDIGINKANLLFLYRYSNKYTIKAEYDLIDKIGYDSIEINYCPQCRKEVVICK